MSVATHMPRGKAFWLLFDLDNGHTASRRYCWWFDTRTAAMRHRREQHATAVNARLSMPVRVTREARPR